MWHSTSIKRYKSILECCNILPEPNIPNSERWSTSRGELHYPLVRHLGGVSLFDFDNFNPKAYSQKYPASSWRTFVPNRKGWDETVWIKINRLKTIDKLINGADLVKKWKGENLYTHKFMPIIECAHLGALPTSSFDNVLVYNTNSERFIKYIPEDT